MKRLKEFFSLVNLVGTWSLLLLYGCAAQPKRVVVDYKTHIKQAQRWCRDLQNSLLQTPVQTKIDQQMQGIDKALHAGKKSDVQRRAKKLADECKRELQWREDVSVLSRDVARNRKKISPELYTRFFHFVHQGDYSNAIVCGEGLLQGHPHQCTHGGIVARRWTEKKEIPPSPELGTDAFDMKPYLQGTKHGKSSKQQTGRMWTWLAFSGSGVALLSGAVLAGFAKMWHSELEELCESGCSQREIEDGNYVRNGKRLSLSADVLLSVGTVAAITGVIHLIVSKKKRTPPKKNVSQRLDTFNYSFSH